MKNQAKKIDLHTHSTASDGKFSPKELVDLAIKKKIPAIAITDHNSVAGNKEALEYAHGKNIEVISGIEITITPPKKEMEIHMVGLFIDYNNKDIRNIPRMHRIYAGRTTRKMIEKLNHLGYKISFQELLNETKGRHLGRPFIAKILMRKYPKRFADRQEIFDKLLGKHGKAFVKQEGTHLKRAIEIIHNAGGIAILAHPWFLENEMEKIVRKFSELGGDGIELDYTPKESTSNDMGKRLIKISKERRLIISGGTDFHEIDPDGKDLGDRGITLSEFKRLKEYYHSRKQRKQRIKFKSQFLFRHSWVAKH
jgi:predicted metal-dependent phosphoesterase TrpH